MSKKIKVESPETAIPATVETSIPNPDTELTLEFMFSQYPNASLRKLAAATEVNYGVLLKKSKDPIPGEAYDPEAINWTAIEATLAKKEVDFKTLNWEELNAGPNRKGAALQKDVEAFPVGCKVYLRKNNQTPYEVVYKTDTHVVLQLEGSQEPIAWANNTFLINGPVFEPRVEKTPAPAEKTKEGEAEEA